MDAGERIIDNADTEDLGQVGVGLDQAVGKDGQVRDFLVGVIYIVVYV